MRVHELAKEFGINSKEFVDVLKNMGIDVKSHMSGMEDDVVEIVRHELSSKKEEAIASNVIEINFPITVKDFSVKVAKKPSEVIAMLMKKRKMLTINQDMPDEIAKELAHELGFTLEQKKTMEEVLLAKPQAGADSKSTDLDSKNLKPRAPIVTIMGHIDHGKTTLLDYIRSSNVAAKESGGITQHISVYSVNTKDGMVTFVDTPGHETFTQMRARGANVTDIVIIVIAADDGIMPQTMEAISHAKAANVPIIVAINKVDKENINIDMVKQQLSKYELTPEDWGGHTITCPVSAAKGTGVAHLLEMIHLQAEMMELKADYERPAMGIVVETNLSKGLGPVASVIVQQGTLKKGDIIVCGKTYGRVRLMRDDVGTQKDFAIPSQAIDLVGLSENPESGDKFFVVPSEKDAMDIVKRRQDEAKADKIQAPKKHASLEDLFGQIQTAEVKDLNIIIKSDTFGTLEAIEGMLAKVDIKEVNIVIRHKGVGPINMSDVILAEATNAIVFGFKVAVEGQASKKAQQAGIEIKTYQIIYELTMDLKAAVEGLIAPDIKRVFSGRARVKQVFNLTKHGIVAGSIIEKGEITRNQKCIVLRNGKEIHSGKVNTLKRFKDDVREVKEGFECGIGVGLNEILVDDIIETFNEVVTSKRVNM